MSTLLNVSYVDSACIESILVGHHCEDVIQADLELSERLGQELLAALGMEA